MDSKKISVIKFLNTDKRNGYIKKLDNNAENDFFFVEKELLNITFEQLKEGVEVQFEPNGNFANKIEILKPERSVISSKIKKLDTQKRTGFISKINQNAKKDFFFSFLLSCRAKIASTNAVFSDSLIGSCGLFSLFTCHRTPNLSKDIKRNTIFQI